MPTALRLTAVLEPRGPAAAVVLSDEQVHALGDGRTAFPVKVTVNGRHTFDGRVARRGGEHLVGFNAEVRSSAGVSPGETIEVQIVLDASERTVEPPPDLADALAAAGVADGFASLAPSHRKEYVRWITEAKRPETRRRRVDEAVARIGQGRPRR